MRLSAAVLSIIAPLALAACGETTAPEPPFTVSVFVASSRGPVFNDIDTVASLECWVTLRAVGHGPGTATWGEGKFYFYLGPDRSVPIDSGTLVPRDIQQSWGASTIDSMNAQESEWQLSASIPFEVAFVFSYNTPKGPVTRTAPVRFACGPTIPQGASAPKFSAVSVDPPSGEIENGDTLTVSYTVSGAIGIWETAVDLRGACTLSRVSAEHLASTASRTVAIVVPPECALGSALNVSVRAYDGAGQGVTNGVATLTVVDHTAPHTSVYMQWLYQSPHGLYVLGGDSVLVGFNAVDNNALRWLFWKLLPVGTVDSLAVAARSLGLQRAMPIPDSSSAALTVRAWTRDAAGLVSDTVGPGLPDTVRVVPTRSHPVRESAIIPALTGMTVDEKRGMVYVDAPYPQAMILGVSLQTLAVTDTIHLQDYATDLDETPSGDSLVVSLPVEAGIGIIDLTVSPHTLTVLPLSGLAPGTAPQWVRTLSNGHAFVTALGDAASETLLDVNLQTGADRVRTDAGANGVVGPAALERSYDHHVIALDVRNNVLAGLQRYDEGTDAFGRIVAHDAWFEPAIDGTGAHIALGTTVFDAALNVQTRGESPAVGLFPVVLSFDGAALYHNSAPFGLVRDSVATGQLVERTRLPFYASDSRLVRGTSDGSMIVAYDNEHSRIAVIDLR